MKCRICENEEHNTRYSIKEKRLGIGTDFIYVKCAKCGCLQIEEYPTDISKYYPSDYYSFNIRPSIRNSCFIKRIALSKIALHRTGSKKSILGELLYRIMGGGTIEKIKNSKVKFDNKILEIGSGSGGNLVRLHKYGFKKLFGIDPFIDEDIVYNSNVKVYKKTVFDFHEEDFDLIFLNHSFEHMPNPLEVLITVSKMIKSGKVVMISVPVIDSFLWRKFGTNWVGLDAPRHFYIHSIQSMKILADKAGFKIQNFEYKTDAFQFWASEQYALGIPLQDDASYYFQKQSSLFPRKLIKDYQKYAKFLDSNRDGGNALFYLLKQ